MACAKVVSSVVAVLVAASFVVILSPSVTWSTVRQDTVVHDINLWKNCFNNATLEKECSDFGKPDPYNNIKSKDNVKTLRDGAIAGCVFTVLFTLMTMISVCCTKKWLSAVLSFFGAICATAVIGSWVEFMQLKGGDWDVDPAEIYKTANVGLAIAATGMVFAWVLFFSSFCIGKSTHDKYGELA